MDKLGPQDGDSSSCRTATEPCLRLEPCSSLILSLFCFLKGCDLSRSSGKAGALVNKPYARASTRPSCYFMIWAFLAVSLGCLVCQVEPWTGGGCARLSHFLHTRSSIIFTFAFQTPERPERLTAQLLSFSFLPLPVSVLTGNVKGDDGCLEER